MMPELAIRALFFRQDDARARRFYDTLVKKYPLTVVKGGAPTVIGSSIAFRGGIHLSHTSRHSDHAVIWVTDQAGAGLPSASVMVTDAATKISRAVQSNEAGGYLISKIQ
jgi:hypothetical protein